MSHSYMATVDWQRGTQSFADNKYSRAHTWQFDGGVAVAASSAPNVLPPPMSREDAVDPEEALVAAAAACHMLFFLALAARKGFTIDRYTDESIGEMTKNERGKLYMSKITLRPAVAWSGAIRPSPADIDALHHRAHEECYIANSIRAEVVIDPPAPTFT